MIGSSLEVVADDARNVGVESLVVGEAGAEGVGDGDVAGAIGVEEPGTAKNGIAAEDERIAEVVVDAAIDHVDALEAVGGAHVDDVVVGDEVAAFDEIDAHLAGEVGVFEVSGVEDAGREQDDVRLGTAFGRKRAQRGEQELRIVLDGTHAVAVEELREGALHDAAVGEHVAHAGRHAQIVFEHDELAGVQAQQVGADDGDVDVAGNLQAAHLAAVVLAAVDQFARNNLVVEDLGFGVDVAQKEIESGDALGEAALDAIPLLRGDEARQQVVGKDPLGSFFPAVDGEGDALGEEGQLGRLLASLQFLLRKARERLGKRAIVERGLRPLPSRISSKARSSG